MSGEQRVSQRLGQVGEGIAAAAEVGLYDLGAAILRIAQRDVPRMTGALARSAFVTVARNSKLSIGYGADYAGRVHERLGRGRKWLQKALMSMANSRGLEVVGDAVERGAVSDFRSVRAPSSEFSRSPQDAR